MINADAVLKSADFEVHTKDRFAAGPSADLAITAAVHAFAAHANAYVRDVVAGAIEVLKLAQDPQAANAALAELQELVGLTE